MKGLTKILNEGIDREGAIKNQACIDLTKAIGQTRVDKITSDDKKITWKIHLKAGPIDMFELAKAIQKIDKSTKYDCIRSMYLDVDTEVITID